MSRRQGRYERRKAAREARKRAFLAAYDRFENVAARAALIKASEMSAKGVKWKASVQKWLLNIFNNTEQLHRDLMAGKDVRRGFTCFDVCERGKVRHIRALKFYERVAQKSLCTNVLSPVMTQGLIYDNGASQKGKGTAFALNRLIKHLTAHYRRFGKAGYVLLLDFKGFFENIDHDVLKRIYRQKIKDEKLLTLIDSFVDAFGDKGLGLGSETSQIHAIAFPNRIDHWIKEVARIKGYGRYMDDSYLICESREKLERILKALKRYYARFGIIVNDKKTHIADLAHGFQFLKTRFHFAENGRIVKKPVRSSIVRERRKIKKQANLVKKGIMTAEQVSRSLESWAGSMKKRNARRTVWNMRCLARSLGL